MKENIVFRILFITKKQTGFAWSFLETPMQNVQRCLSPLFQLPLFLMFPLSKISNPEVNNVVYHSCPSRWALRMHPFLLFKTPWGFISLQNACWIFCYLYIPPCVGQMFKLMVFIFLEHALNLGIFTLQAENMKMTWNITLFIFCMICNFPACDSFIVL